MTIFQIISLLTAGPVALVMLGHFILAIRNKADFHIIQAFILFACMAVILASFFGVK